MASINGQIIYSGAITFDEYFSSEEIFRNRIANLSVKNSIFTSNYGVLIGAIYSASTYFYDNNNKYLNNGIVDKDSNLLAFKDIFF